MEWLEYISFDSFPSFCCAYIGDKWRAHATDDDGWPSILYCSLLEIFFLFGKEREVGKFCESTKESISRCRKYGRPIVFRAVDTGQQIICLFVSPSWPCISIVKSFYYSRDDAFWPGLTLSSILNRAHSRRESEEKKKKRSSFRPSERERVGVMFARSVSSDAHSSRSANIGPAPSAVWTRRVFVRAHI